MTKKKTTAKKTPAKKPTPKKRSIGKKATPKKPTSRRKAPKKKTTRTSAQQGIIPKPIPASPVQQHVMPQVPNSPFGGNEDADEKKLDAYLETYKDKTQITEGELSGMGVIMTRIGLLGAQLGKYTLHRKYANEAFAITIQK